MASEAECDWINWCRLCAKKDASNSIIIGSETPKSIVNAIRKFFDVYMGLEDMKTSNILCIDCYVLVCELMNFTDHVNKVQAGFETLRRMDERNGQNINMSALRDMLKIEERNWSWTKQNKQAKLQNEGEEIENEIEFDTDFIQSDEEDREPFEINKSVIDEQLKSIADLENPIEWVEIFDDFIIKEDPESDSNVEHEAYEEYDNGSTVDMDHEDQIADVPNSVIQYDTEDYDEEIRNQTETESDLESGKYVKEDQLNNIKMELVKIQNKRMKRKKPKNIKGKCDICQKTFLSSTGLKNHMSATHIHVKCYICDCCGKELKSNAALKEHKFVHTDEKPFVCPICNSGFKNKARLRIHSQIHGEPRFGCKTCGKKLQTRAIWVKHQRVHTGERRFACEICGFRCKISTALKCHLLTHMGVRPYVCKYCGKGYASNTNCRAHKLKKHRKELEQDDEGQVSARQPVPTLDELRVMAKKIAEAARENIELSD